MFQTKVVRLKRVYLLILINLSPILLKIAGSFFFTLRDISYFVLKSIMINFKISQKILNQKKFYCSVLETPILGDPRLDEGREEYTIKNRESHLKNSR